jgi:hypothetical protein
MKYNFSFLMFEKTYLMGTELPIQSQIIRVIKRFRLG